MTRERKRKTGYISKNARPDLKNRFYELDDLVYLHIHDHGWIKEIGGPGPYAGNVTVMNAINLLESGYIVEIKDKSMLLKLYNSVRYYNDVFCKANPEVKRAAKALIILEGDVDFHINKISYDTKNANPFRDEGKRAFLKRTIDISAPDITKSIDKYRNSIKSGKKDVAVEEDESTIFEEMYDGILETVYDDPRFDYDGCGKMDFD